MIVRDHGLRVAIGLALALSAGPAAAQNSLPAFGTAVTQDFNTLATAGTSAAVPSGWAIFESGSGANSNYTAGNGGSGNGDSYSFGGTGTTDRALGSVINGNMNFIVGGSFVNNVGGTIPILQVSYTGEQWRLGNVGRTDRLDFQYSLNATSLTTGTWTNVDALDFISPNITALAGPLDGNAAGNRTVVSGAITGLSIPAGAVVWIRWTDFNAQGSDDGLSVDDLSVTAQDGLVPTHTDTWGRIKSVYR